MTDMSGLARETADDVFDKCIYGGWEAPEIANLILAALLKAQQVPEGHTLVPNKPTPYMLHRMQKAPKLGSYTIRILYETALASASQPQLEGEKR